MNVRRFSLPALIGLFILGSVGLFFTSCKSESDDEPKLKAFINTISPAGGIPGMQVTILGRGFNPDVTENIVKFNGVTAEVVLAEETRLIVEVPKEGSTGLITVTINDYKLTGPSFRFYEIFLLTESGLWQIGGDTHELTVWKNGDTLSSVSGYIAGKALKLAGNDTYIAGLTFADQTFFTAHPAYWKNTTLVPLSTETGFTTDIHVQGEDVYVSGMTEDNFSRTHAAYWKNGQLVNLTNGSNPVRSQAKTIEVIGSDVYVGGWAEGSVQTDAVYWKNGEINLLPNADKNTSLEDMKIVGDTIHIAAVDYESAPTQVMYWKTSKEWINLTHSMFGVRVNGMHVGDDKVLIAGQERNVEGIDEGRVWINGTSSGMTHEIKGIVWRVERIGNDVIACGIQNLESDYTIYFAINDLIFPIESGQKLSIVDMVVR